MPDFTVTPLTPSIGAEISDIDLAAPLDGATRERLNRALAEHLALVFHDQSLSPDQYLLAAEAFGPPMR
jgi:taurine dioxygenase